MRHRDALLWRNAWSILVFVLATFVIGFILVSIVFYIRQDWLPGALTTLGTIVDGVAVKWVVDRRSDAVKEEKEAYEDVKKACGDASDADALRAKWTL